MKAIHNTQLIQEYDTVTVVNKAKIQNESNSQRALHVIWLYYTVVNKAKIQNESNSQQIEYNGSKKFYCC